jgi:hypothetical protein
MMKAMVFFDGYVVGEFEVKLPEHLRKRKLDVGVNVNLLVTEDRTDKPSCFHMEPTGKLV